MGWFTAGWPWLGLGAAVVLLALLFGARRVRRPPPDLSPGKGGRRLAVLGLAVYGLHQFEEHGIDLRGEGYAFLGHLCAALGYPATVACPVPTSFITAVNVGTVWIAFAIAIVAGARRPALAVSAFAIPLVNAPIHIVTALREAAYNPGLFTSVLLLLPVTLWALRAASRAGAVRRRDLALIATAGLAMHAVLMGSLMGFLQGWYGETALLAIQLGNALLPALLVLAGCRWSAPRSTSLPAADG